MTEEIQFPIEFKECPLCHCPDTVCRSAYKQAVVDKGKGPDVFASSEKKTVPLTNPMGAVLTVPTLVEHIDSCARCGHRYCTKAEIVEAQIRLERGFPGQSPSLS